uniref:Uncharacterized protein n=1 Tax=Chromera velia CCMP2878 TaxID=1169474 RepID=A0A0G4GCG2_9ALVE|eukprot:Cvel_21220.t1-p1 / transcript=Cvel_21220.t1 / gene=Cvel_21220 / organism=Chromera_velia_CCMP2878 / gene_product=hypothetical protein / transcript_product=hypothetical protein / location=Cvel_scaffold1971:25776-26480(+) / protein_length=235 / sequence_SO=supercontig / SO=protein_coding / is_pseudo=false
MTTAVSSQFSATGALCFFLLLCYVYAPLGTCDRLWSKLESAQLEFEVGGAEKERQSLVTHHRGARDEGAPADCPKPEAENCAFVQQTVSVGSTETGIYGWLCGCYWGRNLSGNLCGDLSNSEMFNTNAATCQASDKYLGSTCCKEGSWEKSAWFGGCGETCTDCPTVVSRGSGSLQRYWTGYSTSLCCAVYKSCVKVPKCIEAGMNWGCGYVGSPPCCDGSACENNSCVEGGSVP